MAAAAATSTSTSPTPSDCTSVSESGKSNLADPVRKCLRALEAAETDTEKFATLFLVPKLVKGIDCDKQARLHLMKGIGYSFLARMLRSKDSPEGCPRLMFQSVALSVLSCFANEEEIMTHPSVLFNLPVLLDIIQDADNEMYEDNLLIITDAYQCITAIVCSDKGRRSFVSNRGVHCLCEIVINQTFRCEDALKLLLSMLSTGTPPSAGSWSYHTGAADFNSLMSKLCGDFASSFDDSKFKLCDTIRTVLRSYPKANFDSDAHPWLSKLQQGLHDILFSKIGKEQRDPAMCLVAAVIEVSDFDWCLVEVSQEGSRFFQIVCNLACIEVIMQLEEKQLDDDMLENSELLVACYFIIESAVSYMASDQNVLDAKQRGQLYAALKNAFSTILKFLHDLSNCTLKDDPLKLANDPKTKYFVCATIRILGAWLSEETMAFREDVYDILPFILTIANETFESQKLNKLQTLPGRGSTDFSNFTEETMMLQRQGDLMTPDTLRFLLPALCHLVVEDKPRKIVVDMKLHETLYTYLSYHWSIFDSFKHWLAQQQAAEDDVDVSEPSFMIDNSKFEMVNSKYAMTTICNVLMNMTVLEPKFVNDTPIFFHILKFIMNSLPNLDYSDENDDLLVLYGNLSILGLLILKNHSRRPKSTDYSLCKFVQAVVRFLWEAHNAEESYDEDEFTVSSQYYDDWSDLGDLWFLGMQVLSAILVDVPWIAEFVIETGWPQHVIRTLSKVRRGGIESKSTKNSYEELLCGLVKLGGKDVDEEFRKCGVIAVCQTHQLKELATLISGGQRQQQKQSSDS